MNSTIFEKVTHNTVLTFGRFKGKKLGEVSPKYLLWLLEKDFLTGGMKRYLKENAEVLKREQFKSK